MSCFMKRLAVLIDGVARTVVTGALLFVPFMATPQVFAAQVVRVAAVHFPPYMVRPEKGEDAGLLPRLIDALNAEQDDYEFVMIPTSVPRRFRDFTEGRFDVAIFENPDWGWRDIPHETVDMGLEDAEVYVARRVEGRGQDYFDTLSDKRLALFSGYHYGFANFNTDQKYLSEHFTITSTYSHDSNLLMVVRGRADIAPVTRSYLIDFMAHNKDEAAQLMVSERVDQIYRQYALLRPNGNIDVPHFKQLLETLRADGELAKIFQPLHIKVLPVSTAQSGH
ncbi:transporter substrate-binding domain-containing protein [Pseudomonas syringae pv. tagetis]|uniref:Amino acid ABC transporter substrate-binding protein, PAAT family n=1 Tax=Pseudomonas syringae pv. tagetis TaxID=129140 RepID=A0A0Q0CAM0_9PSED|nr:transporter substrate-binding domain-containing protein [Pseudomonas syringae group genomosp. 7]KPY84876.1 Amino acid ABC transporter substrate-binding protein, PAAT family [Pseudomonas syringae pv. tagetis]RMR05219.1 Amino acid ABC transporter substrate-binding protein [Pseudomonas syringae pv. helianthi]RMW09967.1 Amino acid ABC transporter substrate-binding protein [Pseudomonas syringae pv. tagetis]RMW22618.1 Amino acid ABC transporter substrate-binding protein [Pseudomonas syringae pv. t